MAPVIETQEAEEKVREHAARPGQAPRGAGAGKKQKAKISGKARRDGGTKGRRGRRKRKNLETHKSKNVKTQKSEEETRSGAEMGISGEQ